MKKRWVLKATLDGTYRGGDKWTWVKEISRAKVFHVRSDDAFYRHDKRKPVWVEVALVEVPCSE